MNPVVICSVPYVDTTAPIMAPAALKSALLSAGIKSVAIDLNIEIVNKIANHPHKQKILDFFFSQEIHEEVVDDIADIIEYCADRIVHDSPSIIGLSLLVYSCQIFTRWLCACIRQKHHCKIVIGGTGIKNFIADSNDNFCQQMKDLGLIDNFISGDGEVSLVEYCKGNLTYPGIDSWNWQTLASLQNLPYPDYDDYNFEQYDKKSLPLRDSVGCVRNCEFCDIIEYWKKFQYRTAEDIFSEMMYQLERYNIKHFEFRNSLTNGNLKEFRRLIDKIACYNITKPDQEQLSWSGYFIVRQASQHPEDLWKKLQITNAELFIGIESVITHVRHRMGKVFSNADIDYHLEMAKKYNIKLLLLMIIGYPTETLHDYEFTKQWFRDRKQYANNPVTKINLSYASVLPGTKLNRNKHELDLKTGKFPSIWINQQLNITAAQRKQYLLDLQKICSDECGFVTLTNEETLEHTTDELYRN